MTTIYGMIPKKRIALTEYMHIRALTLIEAPQPAALLCCRPKLFRRQCDVVRTQFPCRVMS